MDYKPCRLCDVRTNAADLDRDGLCPDCAEAFPLNGQPKPIRITLLPKDASHDA